MTNVSLLDRIAIERECERLIYLATYLNDDRKFDELMDLFTEDALLYRPNSPGKALAGREAMLASYKNRPAGISTFHNCTDILVTVESATAATARSRMTVMVANKIAGTDEPDPATVKGPTAVSFQDTFVLTAKGWKFSKRHGAFWTKP